MLDLKKNLSTYPPKYAPVQNSFLLHFHFTNSKRGSGGKSLGKMGPGSIQRCSEQVAKARWPKYRTCPRGLYAAVVVQGLRVLGVSALVISQKEEATLIKQKRCYTLPPSCLPGVLGKTPRSFLGTHEDWSISVQPFSTEATLDPHT